RRSRPFGTTRFAARRSCCSFVDASVFEVQVLKLYGKMVHGMTPGTFVSGEGSHLPPCGSSHYRAMYLSPNSANGASFLSVLRTMLVHELRGAPSVPLLRVYRIRSRRAAAFGSSVCVLHVQTLRA